MMVMMKYEASCLTCGDTVLPATQQIVDCEGDDLVVSAFGVCPSCGNKYSWYEHYRFQGVSHVKHDEIKARSAD